MIVILQYRNDYDVWPKPVGITNTLEEAIEEVKKQMITYKGYEKPYLIESYKQGCILKYSYKKNLTNDDYIWELYECEMKGNYWLK